MSVLHVLELVCALCVLYECGTMPCYKLQSKFFRTIRETDPKGTDLQFTVDLGDDPHDYWKLGLKQPIFPTNLGHYFLSAFRFVPSISVYEPWWCNRSAAMNNSQCDLLLDKTLDIEMQQKTFNSILPSSPIELTVTCLDAHYGGVKLETSLFITVERKNEFSPIFKSSNVCVVFEKSQLVKGFPIFDLKGQVTDADSGDDGSLSYRIVSGWKTISIQGSKVVLLRDLVDTDLGDNQTSLTFLIKASDLGSPSREADMALVLHWLVDTDTNSSNITGKIPNGMDYFVVSLKSGWVLGLIMVAILVIPILIVGLKKAVLFHKKRKKRSIYGCPEIKITPTYSDHDVYDVFICRAKKASSSISTPKYETPSVTTHKDLLQVPLVRVPLGKYGTSVNVSFPLPLTSEHSSFSTTEYSSSSASEILSSLISENTSLSTSEHPSFLTSDHHNSLTSENPSFPTIKHPMSPSSEHHISPTSEQPSSPTSEQHSSPTLEQPSSPTLEQPSSPTSEEPSYPTIQPSSQESEQPSSPISVHPSSPTSQHSSSKITKQDTIIELSPSGSLMTLYSDGQVQGVLEQIMETIFLPVESENKSVNVR